LVLSFLFCFFLHHFSLRSWCFFFLNKMWAGVDHLVIIMILDVNRTWILTHRRRWKKRCRKSRDMGNNLCWVCSRKTADSADSMRDPQGKEGFMGQLHQTQSLFSSQNTSRQAGRAGSAASDKNLWAGKKEGRKEGNEWCSLHMCVSVCGSCLQPPASLLGR
jgi:hypothetical protein